MCLPLLLLQCSICLVRLTWIVSMIDSWWTYRCCFKGFYLQDLFNSARSIFVYLPPIFFTIRLVSIHVVHLYTSIDMTAAWKNYVLFYRSRLTSIWPIVSWELSIPLLVVCWCYARLMRHCFRGRWTCPLFSEDHPFVWRYRLFFFFIKAHVFRLVCIDRKAWATCCSFQKMRQEFGMGRWIC